VHLLHEALSRAKGGDSGLAEAVLQIAKHLDVERCDLLELGTPHGGGSTGVLYRVRQPRPTPAAPPEPEAPMPATEAPTTARRRGKRRASNDGPVAIEAVQIATQQSPLDLLRSEGMVDRVHVFIARPSGGDLLGILSVQNSTSRRLSIDERAFLDAVADLIALAIERRVLISADELLATAAQFE
jgi:GAF domain-containing protein